MKSILAALLAGFAVLVVSACQTGAISTSSATDLNISASIKLSGSAIKGMLSNATVTAYKLNEDGTRGESLGATNTTADGSYQLNLSYAWSNAVEIEVSGGQYKDEATGSNVSMGTNKLQAILSNALICSNSGVVSPLTTMAAFRVKANAQNGIAASLRNANNDVAALFGLDNVDIGKEVPTDLSTAASAGASDNAKKYGSILAALTQTACDKGITADKVMLMVQEMAKDYEDGLLNGTNSAGTPVQNQSGITSAQTIQAFGTSLSNFMLGLKNASGYTNMVQTRLQQNGSTNL